MRNTHRNSTATFATLSVILPELLATESSSLYGSLARFCSLSLKSLRSLKSLSGRSAAVAVSPPRPPRRLVTDGMTAARSTSATGDRRYAGLNRSLQALRTNSNRNTACNVFSALSTVAGSIKTPNRVGTSGTHAGRICWRVTARASPKSKSESSAEMAIAPKVVPTVHTPERSTRSRRSLALRWRVSACHSARSNALRSR